MANTFYNKFSSQVGTGATDIGGYVVPSDSSTTVVVVGCSVANVTVTAVNASVSLYDGSTEYFLVKNAPVSAGSSLVVVGGDQKIVLEAGHSIRVTGSAASSLDCVMSVMEIT